VKQTSAVGAALAVATVAIAGVFYLMPTLEAAPRQVENKAAVHLERARRLLHQHDANLGFHDILVTSLRELGVEGDEPEEMSDEAADVYQQAHTRLWEFYNPVDGIDPPRPARANYGNLDSQIQKGVQARESIIADNERLLSEANQAVREALAVSVGGVDARSHAEANRLQAMIELYEGLERRLQAGRLRNEAALARRDFSELAGTAEALATSMTILDGSGLADQLEGLREHLQEWTQAVRAREAERQALVNEIAALERRVADAESRRDKARRELDELRQRGIDFTDPNGPANFMARITEQDRVYREAVREMESLQAGSYPYAQIDATGDFVNGRYLENGSPVDLTIEPGLRHYEAELAVADAELERLRVGLEGLQDDIGRLEAMRDRLEDRQDQALEQVGALKPDAQAIFEELAALEDEAYRLEEEALDRLDAAARTSRNAAAGAGAWISDAQSRTSGMSPSKMEQSAFSHRSKAGWMSGHIAALAADAELAKARIHYARFEAARRNADLFAVLPAVLELTEADAAAEREVATAARDAGVEAVTEAHSILERAYRDAERHWTFVAQEAGATYLLALFGDESYVADAVAAYREALKGREGKPFTQRIAARLRHLEAR